MLEDEVRRIPREVVREKLAKLQSDRPDAPLTAGQVRLVHARRSAAGVSPDELRVLLGERWGVDSLPDLSHTRLDVLLDRVAGRRSQPRWPSLLLAGVERLPSSLHRPRLRRRPSLSTRRRGAPRSAEVTHPCRADSTLRTLSSATGDACEVARSDEGHREADQYTSG